MKNKNWLYLLLLSGLVLILTNGCKKKDNELSTTKINPVITWTNPADIFYGTLLKSDNETLLSITQLNATADVPGTFVYTPPAGTKLNVGNNQDLRVDFTPTDAVTYNTASKTVKINVTQVTTVNDIDNNIYNIITIGTQVWMAENLKTTKYNDGTTIPKELIGANWAALTTPAYCWYENAPANKAVYGALYNWYAVNTGKLCPTGWHVPTDDEWTTLITYLGGESVAGSKIKETGTTNWKTPNSDATNASGFTAVPGGLRNASDGTCSFFSINGIYWSSTSNSTANAWNRIFVYNDGSCVKGVYSRKTGLSVRCIKD